MNIAWSTFQQIGGNTATRHCLSSIGTDNSRGNVTLLGGAVNLLKDHAYSWRSIRIKRSQSERFESILRFTCVSVPFRPNITHVQLANWLSQGEQWYAYEFISRLFLSFFCLFLLLLLLSLPFPPLSLFFQSNKRIFIYLSALIADTKEYKGRC